MILIKTVVLLYLVYHLGFFYGLALFITLLKMKTKCISLYFGYDSLSGMDYVYLYDDYKNRATILGTAVFEKFNA